MECRSWGILRRQILAAAGIVAVPIDHTEVLPPGALPG
jgi:hypothetical protein